MHLLKSLLMFGTTMYGHIHIMVTRLRSKPGQESAIIKTQVLQKCLTTTKETDWKSRDKKANIWKYIVFR